MSATCYDGGRETYDTLWDTLAVEVGEKIDVVEVWCVGVKIRR
jgi:hypothetical protein